MCREKVGAERRLRSISLSSSTCIVPGARSKSPNGERRKTMPDACTTSSTSIIPTPRSSGSFKTIYRPTPPVPCIRRSRPPKPGGFCAARVPLHSQARKLAQHGRDRDRRPARPVPGSQDRRSQATAPRNRRLGTEAKCRPLTHQMDVHDRQGPRQNGARLSRHFQRVIITVQSH